MGLNFKNTNFYQVLNGQGQGQWFLWWGELFEWGLYRGAPQPLNGIGVW